MLFSLHTYVVYKTSCHNVCTHINYSDENKVTKYSCMKNNMQWHRFSCDTIFISVNTNITSLTETKHWHFYFCDKSVLKCVINCKYW